GGSTNAVVTIREDKRPSSRPPTVGRYWRGTGEDPTYWSQVVPLDYERGIQLSNVFGNATNLYPSNPDLAQLFYHYDGTNYIQTGPEGRIAFNNPIVGFGGRIGGSPLYYNQKYSFGISAGDPFPFYDPILIQVYYR